MSNFFDWNHPIRQSFEDMKEWFLLNFGEDVLYTGSYGWGTTWFKDEPLPTRESLYALYIKKGKNK